jgi:hypothetical protein
MYKTTEEQKETKKKAKSKKAKDSKEYEEMLMQFIAEEFRGL